MKKTILTCFTAGALALATLAGSALPGAAKDAPKDPKVIKLGAILAMSGPANRYGKVMNQGIQLAIEEINAKGGLNGIKLEAVIEDHKSGVAKEGVAAMNRLLSLHDVKMVLTSFSAPTLAIAPIADEKKVLLLNGGGVSNSLVGASKYLFHNRSLASDLGKAALAHALGLKKKKMAQLVWKNDAGESVLRAAKPFWLGLGGKISATESVDVGAANIDTQIAKIRASKPDFVALWLFSPETGLALKRLREFGYKNPIIGIEFTPDVKKVAGDAANGFEYTSDFFTPSEQYPWSKSFADAYKKRFGEDPDFYAANYYENVYVAFEALKRAREANGGDYYSGDIVAAAIRKNPKFKSVYGGEMKYKANGVAQKRTALFRIEKGERKFIKYIDVK